MSKPTSPDASSTAATVGRRAAARLRLSIPARFISTKGTHECVLIDLSSTGAQIAMAAPLPCGEAGFLKVAGLEVFGEAVRFVPGLGGGVNGLMFDDLLPHDAVLSVRRHAETFQQREHQALLDQVRSWVTGEK
ncbi:MAG: PilZ domain-containing protein [Sphingomonadales bacterium]|nr:PilZ domain-containing protein [Sphingomonadales bacterium]NCQ22072.1 PilZ domain-containing protein [Sphingomonadales bacterium]NCT03177.1 PilZ domain-containing protein [Sphingomonadales bacterium]